MSTFSTTGFSRSRRKIITGFNAGKVTFAWKKEGHDFSRAIKSSKMFPRA